MLHRLEEVFVKLVGLFVAGLERGELTHEALALVVGVVQLAEGVGALHAADEAFEALDEARVVGRLLGERTDLERVLGDEHRLDQVRFDRLAEERVDLHAPGWLERHRGVEPVLLDGALQAGHVARLVGGDVNAAGVEDGLAHGEPRPRRPQVDLVAAEVRDETAHGFGGRAHERLDHGHDVVVVDVGFVGLEHRELGVVLEAHALVAEVLAHLVDAVDAADDAALEVELDGDAQVEVALELVVVGHEGPRHGAAVERLQDGRLDLDEAALVEESPDGRDDAGTLDEDLARVVVDDRVEVTTAVARLDVGQAVELLGQRTQGLGQELPGDRPQRQLAAAGLEHRALGADEVADVDVEQALVGLGAERVEGGEELQVAGTVLDRQKGELAVLATRHDPAGGAERAGRLGAGLERVEALVQRGDLVAVVEPRGKRDVATLAQPGQLAASLLGLVGARAAGLDVVGHDGTGDPTPARCR